MKLFLTICLAFLSLAAFLTGNCVAEESRVLKKENKGLSLTTVIPKGDFAVGREAEIKIILKNETDKPIAFPLFLKRPNIKPSLELRYVRPDTNQGGPISGFSCTINPEDVLTLKAGQSKTFSFNITPLLSGKARLQAKHDNNVKTMRVRTAKRIPSENPRIGHIMYPLVDTPIPNVWTGAIILTVPVTIGKNPLPLKYEGIKNKLKNKTTTFWQRVKIVNRLAQNRHEHAIDVLSTFAKKLPSSNPLKFYSYCQLADIVTDGICVDKLLPDLISQAENKRNPLHLRRMLLEALVHMHKKPYMFSKRDGNTVFYYMIDATKLKIQKALENLSQDPDASISEKAETYLSSIKKNRPANKTGVIF